MSILASCAGIASCAEIALALVVPWFRSNVFMNSELAYHREYGLLGYWSNVWIFHEYPEIASDVAIVGGLMDRVTVIVVLALFASIAATVLSVLGRRVPGVIAGVASSSLLLISGAVFYFGMIDALGLDYFSGHTYLNRTCMLETWAGPGFVIAVAVPVVQATQAILLAYSGRD